MRTSLPGSISPSTQRTPMPSAGRGRGCRELQGIAGNARRDSLRKMVRDNYRLGANAGNAGFFTFPCTYTRAYARARASRERPCIPGIPCIPSPPLVGSRAPLVSARTQAEALPSPLRSPVLKFQDRASGLSCPRCPDDPSAPPRGGSGPPRETWPAAEAGAHPLEPSGHSGQCSPRSPAIHAGSSVRHAHVMPAGLAPAPAPGAPR
jgi:hypothetical protein